VAEPLPVDAGPAEDPPAGPVLAASVLVFSDESSAARRTLAAIDRQQPPPDLDVRVSEVVAPSGDAATRQRAMARSKGSYIAVVEAGTVPGPTWLARSIEALRDDPTLGLASLEPDGATGFRIDPSLAAFVCRRTMWEAIGGLDGNISAATWGLDVGWRLWLLGWRAAGVTVDDSVVPPPEPGCDEDLHRLCARSLRSPAHHPGSRSRMRLRRESGPTRRRLQRDRRRPDGELGVLLKEAIARGGAAANLAPVLDRAGASRLLEGRRKVIVATADTLAPTMAGPGIRAWRIAGALADAHDVHLVTTGRCELEDGRFPVEHVEDDRFAELVHDADVVVFQGWVMADRPWLASAGVVIVADIYDPMHLEQLEQGRDAPFEGGRWVAVSGANEVLNQQLRRGDYFLCASQKQRDFWLGQMAAVGRVNLILYDEDNALRERMRIVPFGIEDQPPCSHGGALRGAVPGIEPDDEIVLWGGGIYNWFDPLTLIRAVDRLRHRRQKIRLYFLGTRHPNPEIPEMRMATAARRLAHELGLVGSHVFFNDGWVPFDKRADYLMDADVAVSIHKQHIETEYSFRTRILDYLWCARPIIATAGDSFAPLIVANELGAVVAPEDVEGLESALDRLLADDVLRQSIAERSGEFSEQFRWSNVLESVVEICGAPRRAPDVACPDISVHYGIALSRTPAWREDLTLIRTYLSEGGLSLLVRRVRSRLHRLRAEGG
jgi:glycosyltransferase involved in cell wall biosynthesis